MRVALVIERMNPALGGRETYTAQVAAALARRGVEVAVLCQEAAWSADGVQVHELGRRGAMRHQRLANFVTDAARAAGTVRGQSGFDIVHAMLPLPGATIYHPHGGVVEASSAGSRARRGAVGRLLARFGTAVSQNRRLTSRLERQVVAGQKTCCLCVSPKVAQQFRTHYGRTGNVRVVFNGVDAPGRDNPQRLQWRRQRRQELGLADAEPLFLMVATNLELKGAAETIQSFASWISGADPPTQLRKGQLVIVGRRHADEYRKLARQLGVEAKVHLLPPTPALFEWWAAADVHVLLTWYDPCSLVVLEATRWGIPSVTTAMNGAADVLRGGGGIVVDSPRSTSAIVQALDELADPQRRAERSRACLAVADTLSLERHVDSLVALYQELANSPADVKPD